MTFNIRYDNPGDGVHAWPNRLDRVASTIQFNDADVIGVQEALHHQLTDLEQALTGYSWIGAGRDDGKQAGEYTAIFYKTGRFSVIDSETFWLSTTPDVPGSRDWDAAITRITTWVHFEDSLGAPFYFFNTHFDHRGLEARTRSAELIVSKIDDIAGQSPAVLVGDFNSTEDTDAYRTIVSALSDAQVSARVPHHGPDATHYGGFEVTGEPGSRIDYIFVNDGLLVERHATLSDNWSGAFASDHLAVIAELVVGQN